MDRFRVLFIEDARKQDLEVTDKWHDFCYHIYDYKTDPPTFIACDSMQPEDAYFVRDLCWIPELLNRLNKEIDEK